MRILFRLAPAGLVLATAFTVHASMPMACTMDAKLCPDGVTYVGRDGNNDCEWQACPGEAGACTAEQCGEPSIAMPNWPCPDGSAGGPMCARANDGSCGWVVRDCPNDSKFSDVPTSHPNSDAIFYVKAHGIVQGYPDGTFKPDQPINRAEFTKIVMGGYNAVEGQVPAQCGTDGTMQLPFSDVRQDDWFAFRVCIAAAGGVVTGYPDGTFRPANPINFVEAAKIVAHAFNLEATTTVQACQDADSFECPWYRPYVRMLETKRAIPLSVVRFGQNITRGEMAEMIYRLRMGGDKPSKTFDELQFMVFCDGRIAAGDATCE